MTQNEFSKYLGGMYETKMDLNTGPFGSTVGQVNIGGKWIVIQLSTPSTRHDFIVKDKMVKTWTMEKGVWKLKKTIKEPLYANPLRLTLEHWKRLDAERLSSLMSSHIKSKM